MKDFWIYLIILAGSTYLIRAVPFSLLKRKITNRFVRSFLYYIPFAVLASMTFPAVVYSTGNVLSGLSGLVVGSIFAFRGKGLTIVACASCLSALVVEVTLRSLT